MWRRVNIPLPSLSICNSHDQDKALMNEIYFFAEKIQEINKELGVSVASGFLESAQEHLDNLSRNDGLAVDIYHAQNTGAAIKKRIRDWEASGDISIRVVDRENFGARSIQSASPAIAICFLDEAEHQAPSIVRYITNMDDQYKMVVIMDEMPEPEAAVAFAKSLGSRIRTRIINSAETTDLPLGKLLPEYLPQTQLPALKSLGRLNQVQPVLTLLQQVFQTENKIAQTRKQLSAQSQLISRKDEQALNNSELANTVRLAIQKFSNDMDKSFRSKYEELNKPVSGNFSKEVLKLSEELKDFKRENRADKDERVEIKLEDAYQKMFVDSVKNTIRSEMKKDSEFLTRSYDELLSRVNQLLTGKNMTALSVQKDLLSFPDPKNSITSYCQFNRQYKSELIKKGMMEYFVALRDYTGIIMVATGLLGPLTIVASISENGFLKHLSDLVKFGMAGIAIVLIVYGVYDLRTRIPRKREEEFEKEVEKGREFVQNEGKRMFNEVSRDWISGSINWVKEASQAITNSFEKQTRDAQQAKLNLVTQDKIQQQRYQASVDAQLRSLVTAERMKDTLATRYRDLYADAEKKLNI